jgi:hypothetical protein
VITILDVIDNFFGEQPDILRVPGKALMEFGEQVRKFAVDYEPPPLDASQHPTYLGGWPSANFWDGLHGHLTMTSLLYSGQVLVTDPVSDWFSDERYLLEPLMRSRPGYLKDSGEPAVAETRQFLSVVIPALAQLKPLIKCGAVVLAPSRRFLFQHRDTIDCMHTELVERLAADPLEFTRRFEPSEVPVEDNVRGLFVFAGGDQEHQIRQAIEQSLRFFTGEYCFAQHHGAEYTAPFRYEQYVCKESLEKALLSAPGSRVVQALLKSEMPLYNGLTPTVIAEVRDDEYFADFRAGLYSLYRDVPFEESEVEVARHLSEAEQTLLAPVLRNIDREVDRGRLAKAGLKVAGSSLRVATSLVLGQVVAPTAGLVQVGAGLMAEEGVQSVLARLLRRRRNNGPATVWKKLYAHQKTVNSELVGVVSGGSSSGDYWGIPAHPSRSVTVSKGYLILDYLPQFQLPSKPGSATNVYGPCGCGSGEKFKFCCRCI